MALIAIVIYTTLLAGGHTSIQGKIDEAKKAAKESENQFDFINSFFHDKKN